MQYIVYFDMCAISIIIVEIVMFYLNRNIRSIQNKLFSLMLAFLFISAICDLLCGEYRNNAINMPFGMYNIILYAYFIFHSALPFLFVIYDLAMTEQIHRGILNIKSIIFTLPFVITMVLFAVNPYTDFLFTTSRERPYVRQPGMAVVYVQAMFYFMFAVVYIQLYKSVMDIYKRLSIYLFIILTLAPLAIQMVYPLCLVEVFGETLGFVALYMCVQNPEEMMDRQFGIFNKNAFISKSRMNLKSGNEFSIISISIDEWDFLQRTFGIDGLKGLFSQFVKVINGIVANENFEIYHISDNELYILATRQNKDFMKIANRIMKECDRVWKTGEIEMPLTVDICVISCPEDIDNVDDIFQCSDFIAKEDHGYGSRVLSAKELRSGYGIQRNAIKKAIHKAIINNTLEVYYQPIFSTKENRVLSAEALVRLKDDELGYISPEEFIPIAESDGSILKIGNFVLESVCRFMMENDLEEKGIEFIEVNVSVVECLKQDMAERVANMVKKYNIKPKQVNLEITETAASNSSDIMNTNMQNLVEKGIAFSLDDYGSGYSNISYIINLPFHLVKMDKSIVWSAFDSEKAGTVLESSVSMIRKLDLKIVAEGVETKEQKDALTNMGCEYLQGYYFSKPLPEKEFLEYIDKCNIDTQTICDV